MNDFTKEELEDLVIWGEVYTEFGCSWGIERWAIMCDTWEVVED